MPSIDEIKIRCPVDEIGKNSVRPSIIPKIAASITVNIYSPKIYMDLTNFNITASIPL